MTIMRRSVTERPGKMGVRKSRGRSRRDIRRQFLAESVMLSFLGGFAGLLAGAALAGGVQLALPLPARGTLWAVAGAPGPGATAGLVFGGSPPPRAGRPRPRGGRPPQRPGAPLP